MNILELLLKQISYSILGIDLNNKEHYKWYDSFRKRHQLIKGKSGTGKSAYIYGMILMDILRGYHGLCMIDPVGTLFDSLMDALAGLYRFLTLKAKSPYPMINKQILALRDKVFSKIVILDFSKPDCSGYCFNPLEMSDGLTSAEVAGDFMRCFERVTGGDMAIQARRQLVLRSIGSLVSEAGGTLMDAVMLLAMSNKEVESFIKTLLIRAKLAGKKVNLKFVRYYMQQYFTRMTERERRDLVASSMTAMDIFLGDETVFNFVRNPIGNLDLEKIVNEGGYLFVKLPRGADLNTQIVLGSMIINRIQLLCERRDSEQTKKDFSLIVDEFHLLFGSQWAEAVATVRNKGLNLIMLHQNDTQLLTNEGGEELLESVTSNSSTHVLFQISAEDAMRATYRLFRPDGHMAKLEYEEITRSHQTSKSRAVAESISEAISQSKSFGKGKTVGTTNGHSISFSESDSTAVAEMKGTGITVATGNSWSRCESKKHNIAVTFTDSETQVEGLGKAHGNSNSASESESEGYSHSTGQNQMEGHSFYMGFDAEGRPTSHNSGISMSEASGTQKSQGRSVSRAISDIISSSRALAQSKGKNISTSDGSGISDTIGGSESEAHSKTIANSLATIKGYAKGMSESISNSVSHSESITETKGTTETKSRSTTETEGESSGTSRTKKTTYYSVDEEARVKSYLLTDLRKREAFVYTGEDGKVTKIRTIDLPFGIQTKTGNIDYVEVVRNICRPEEVQETHETVFERIKDNQLNSMTKTNKLAKGF